MLTAADGAASDLVPREITYANFKVVAPDHHRFDGDKDGVVCET